MEKTTRIAFDLGGVVIERGAIQNFLVDQSIVSVKLAIQKFGQENVFIISKAKDKYKERNIQFLQKNNFFTETGLREDKVHFVNQYEDKGILGKQLKIDYILDDSIKVAKFAILYGFKPILFGKHQEVMK